MIQLKRVYEKPSRKDGVRILVDRLWPRGLTKRARGGKFVAEGRGAEQRTAQVVRSRSGQMEGVSGPLPERTSREKDALKLLKQKSEDRTVTLVYGARDEQHNEAVVLRKIVEGRKR